MAVVFFVQKQKYCRQHSQQKRVHLMKGYFLSIIYKDDDLYLF